MSSAQSIANILNVASKNDGVKGSSSNKQEDGSGLDSIFHAALNHAMNGHKEEVKQADQPKKKDVVAHKEDVKDSEVSTPVPDSPNLTLSLLQAAMMGNAVLISQGLQGDSSAGDVSDEAKGSKRSYAANLNGVSVFSQKNDKAGLSLADESLLSLGSTGGVVGSQLGDFSSQEFDEHLSNLLVELGHGKATQAADANGGPSSRVVLSGEGMFTSAATSFPQQVDSSLALPLKTVQSALGDYWVPPVQVTTQGATGATLQMGLRDGGTLTLHLQIDSAQNAMLRVEAPAAALADLQMRLAPLQEALMQQGMTLAPIQWSLAKTPAGRVTSGLEYEKETLAGDRLTQTDGEASPSGSGLLARRVVPATTFVEDLLE